MGAAQRGGFTRACRVHPVSSVVHLTAAVLSLLVISNAVWGEVYSPAQEEPSDIQRFAAVLNATLVQIVKDSGPAVVSISTTKFDYDAVAPGDSTMPSGRADNYGARPDDEPRKQNPMRKTGIGSGTIVRLLGHEYVLTNHHVVHGVDRIAVGLEDKREYDAYVKGWDPKVDIAVLELPEADNLPAARLGNSDYVQAGEMVLAIGSPFGLPHTVTVGIVSSVGRHGQGIEEYEDFIQTDAAINRGNSGGPLLNLAGEVVGLNTAIRTTHMGGNIGIGFAIPINMISSVAEQLVKSGHVARGWLGVSVQNITADLAEAFDLPEATGVVVTNIVSGTPAEKGGLERRDVIVQIGGVEVTNANKLRNFIAASRPGSEVEIAVIRGRSQVVLKVPVGEKPYAADEFRPPPKRKWHTLGLTLQDVSGDIAAAVGLESPTGALVAEVEMGSLASHARPVPLVRGDVILEMRNRPVKNAVDLRTMLKKSAPGEPVLFFIHRRGNTLFTVVRMPDRPQEISDGTD